MKAEKAGEYVEMKILDVKSTGKSERNKEARNVSRKDKPAVHVMDVSVPARVSFKLNEPRHFPTKDPFRRVHESPTSTRSSGALTTCTAQTDAATFNNDLV